MDMGDNQADAVDMQVVVKELSNELNTAFSKISKLSNFKYNLLIYKLVKKGLISKADMAREAGVSETRIYEILNDVEKQL